MDFTIENNGSVTYLVYAVSKEEILDTLSLGMVRNNSIPGILPILYAQLNQNRFLKYNISSKVPLSVILDRPVTRKRLLGVFSSLLTALASAEEYMIDTASFLMDPEKIYVDVVTSDAYLVCIPVSGKKQENFLDFFKNILYHAQFDTQENCDYVARIMSVLNSSVDFQTEELLRIIRQLKEEPQKPAVSSSVQPVLQPVPENNIWKPSSDAEEAKSFNQADHPLNGQNTEASSDEDTAVPAEKGKRAFSLFGKKNPEKKKQEKEKPARKAKKSGKDNSSAQNFGFMIPGTADDELSASAEEPESPSQKEEAVSQEKTDAASFGSIFAKKAKKNDVSVKMDFGDTVPLNQGKMMKTSLLHGKQSSSQTRPYLIRVSNQEKIYLTKPIFHIGREASYADYAVSENSAVSASHADFKQKDGQVYIVDTNSTNRTFINGEEIPSSREIPLTHGDKVRLADEEFQFFAY